MTSVPAVRIREPGGPEVLELGSTEVRGPGPGEVSVAVEAAGLNRADLLQRRGRYPAPPGVAPDVPGLEFAGRVAAVGPGPNEWSPGDRVMGIVGGGAMARTVITSSRELLPIPRAMDFVDAAAIPEAFTTAYDGLFRQGRLELGETVVVHAAASGVGTAALQLGRAAGVRVVGTSRTKAKLEACQALGLEEAVLVDGDRFADVLRERVGAPELVFDSVGASYLAENVRLLKPKGRLVLYGLMGGAAAEVPLGEVLRKRLTLVGTVLRTRSPEEKAELAQAFRRHVLPLFDRGLVRPVVDRVLPMAEVSQAHQLMESNATVGKVVLRWS